LPALAGDAPSAESSGIRNLGSGDGSSHRTPDTPPAAAIQSVGLIPITEARMPPTAAPTGRVP
jgi:hypothetical protein